MVELEQLVARAGCLSARIGGALIFAPFLGSTTLPPRIKVGLAVAITLLLYPAYSSSMPVLRDVGDWTSVVAGEFLIGLLVGLGANLVFEALQLAGQAIGFQMGFSLVNVIDPQTQVDTPVLGVFHQTIGLLIFLQLNVHHSVLRSLGRSLQLLPPGTFLLDSAITGEFIRLAGVMWSLGFRIAAPVLAATLLADIALGFLSKASPNFPALVVGLSAKTVLALLLLISGLAFLPRLLEHHFELLMHWIENLLRLQ